MSASKRKDYIPIYTPLQGDVLKLSVSFRPKRKKGTCSVLKEPFFTDFLTPRFYRIETFLREKHFAGSKADWTSKKKHEKAIIAYYLTCYYLCESDNHAQDKFEFEKLFHATTEYKINIRKGFMFPYLYPYTLSLLEHILGDNSVRLNFVYETYGAKGRASQQVIPGPGSSEDYLKEVAEKLLAKNRRLATDSICQFAKFSKDNSRKLSSKLTLGYGCNFSADTNGQPQYPVLDSYRLRQEWQKSNTVQPFSPVDHDDHDDHDERDDQPESKECDDEETNFQEVPKAVPNQNIQEVPIADLNEYHFVDLRNDDGVDDVEDSANLNWTQLPYRDSFNVLGNTLPVRLQPITVKSGDHRFQMYSVNLRQALGENSQAQSTSALACDVTLYISQSNLCQSENSKGYHIDRQNQKVLEWSKLVSENCKNLEGVGNISRIEIALPVNNLEEVETEITNGIITTWKYLHAYVEVYSASDIAQIANFFAKALRFRVHVADKVSRGCYTTTPDDMRIFNVLSEVCAYIKHFYSGQKSDRNFNITGKKLGKMHNRPILKTVSHDFYDGLWRIGISEFNHIWKSFQKHLGVTFDDTSPDLFKHTLPERFPRKLVCEHCMRILDEGVDARNHPCRGDAKMSLRTFTDPIIINKIREIKESLSTDQQKIIQTLINSRKLGELGEVTFDCNVLITGVAGSGKSTTAGIFLLEFFRVSQGRATAAVISPTKNAAGVLYGKTVNSFFHLGCSDELDYNQNPNFFNSFHDKYFLQTNELFRHITNLEVLVIDECSLLTALGLENIDRMLGMIRDTQKPFGGIQVILVGDPLQLPPVINEKRSKKTSNKEQIKHSSTDESNKEEWHSDWRYFFQAPSFWNGGFVVVHLSDSYRQMGDDDFIQILNRIRDGRILLPEHLEQDLDFLNNRCGRRVHRTVVEITFQAEQEFHRTRKSNLSSLFNDESRFRRKLEDPEVVSHFQHLETDETKLDITKSFVICAENEEALAVGAAFDHYMLKKTVIVTSTAKDHFSMKQEVYFPYDVSNIQGNLTVLSDTYKRSLDDEMSKLTKRETNLNLYIGKIVKFVSNGIDMFVANNMLGVIKKIEFDENTEEISQIIVQPIPHQRHLVGKEISVKPMTEIYSICLSKDQPASLFELNGSFNRNDYQYWELKRVQFPVHSANAGTVYIFQGTTCPDEAMMLICPQYFQHAGSTYTAISRVRNKDQLFLLFPLTAKDIIVNPVAKEFDSHHRSSGDDGGIRVLPVDYYYKGNERVACNKA